MIIRRFQGWFRKKNAITQKPLDGLIDVAHAVLSEEEMEKSQELGHLEKWGGSLFRRRRLKEKVRAKVAKSMKLPADDAENMVEEITEKMTEAALMDPHFESLLDEVDQEK